MNPKYCCRRCGGPDLSRALPAPARLRILLGSAKGQSTVEAALLLPLLLTLVLLLAQPGIILYDRMVMKGAAAEGCRLLATVDSSDRCENFVKRHLGAIPQQDCFHVHSGACSWDIQMEGGPASSRASVSISTQVKPLPLIDLGATLLGLVNSQGYFEVKVSESAPTQPDWVSSSPQGSNPAAWVGAWLDE